MMGARIAILAALAAVSMEGGASAATIPSAAMPGGESFGRPVARKVDVRIFSSSTQRVVWHGEGNSVVAADLCVASTTGHYRLRVMSTGGGGLVGPGAGKLFYTVRFTDQSGAVQTQRVDGKAMVTFDGSSGDRADCHSGANATLEIEAENLDLQGQVAGSYTDSLHLSADPL
jgi:hypothetical protein